MDCGIGYHRGCPLGSLIPGWKTDLVYRGDPARSRRLEATNNFPLHQPALPRAL
ncbi:MAG: hypothetical protein U0271_10065 [Polyangiaceae bacterium]